MQYPKRLKIGDTIGLVAPSGAIRTEGALEKAVERVKALGFRVKLGESCGQVYGYLSGRDEVRARDINRMFADDDVDGIFCVRGGYGAPRILSMLDYEMIGRHPKPFLGYSDVTALHIALLTHCGLATYHGPMPVSDWIGESFQPFSMESLMRALTKPIDFELRNPPGCELETANGGRAEGTLVGGNLTLISGLVGTPHQLDCRDKILFLEEIGEKTYCVDHKLSQLKNAGVLDACAGFLLGQFTDCPIEYPDFGLSLRQIVSDLLVPTGKPILMNLMAGHCQPSLTLPLGAWCTLDADARRVGVRWGSASNDRAPCGAEVPPGVPVR